MSTSIYLCLTISILHCDAFCCHTYHASCLTTPQPTLMKRSCKPLPLERMAGVASLWRIYQHNQTIKITPHSPIISQPGFAFVWTYKYQFVLKWTAYRSTLVASKLSDLFILCNYFLAKPSCFPSLPLTIF